MTTSKQPLKNRILSIILALCMLLSCTTMMVFANAPESNDEDAAVYELGYHSGIGYMKEYIFVAKDISNNKYYAMTETETSYKAKDITEEDLMNPDEYDNLPLNNRALKAVEVTGADNYITLASDSSVMPLSGSKTNKRDYDLYTYSHGDKNLTFYRGYTDYVDNTGRTVYVKNMHLFLGSTSEYQSIDSNLVYDKLVPVSVNYNGTNFVDIYDINNTRTGMFDGTNIGCNNTLFKANYMWSDYDGYIALNYKAEAGYIFCVCADSNKETGFRGIASVYTRVCTHENMVHHPFTPATDEEDGRAEYYNCPDCGGVFTDAEATNVTYEYYIPVIHNLVKQEQKDATCTEDGVKQDYYKCTNCGELFYDSEGQDGFYNERSLILPAPGHSDANGDMICDDCGERLSKKSFVKVTDMSEVGTDGRYILVDANNKVMAKPEIDETDGYPSMGTLNGITVSMENNEFDYYKCKALNALIFNLTEVPGISSQFEDSNDKALEMHFDNYTMTCYGGCLGLEPSEYTKYGMRIRMEEDGSALIGSVYDYWWEDALTTDADKIYFRSITDTETGEVVFVAISEEGVAANKVYLYRLNEPHTHQFGEWIPSNDGIHHEHSCACGVTETAEHTWDDGVITTPATHTAEGEILYTCTICGGTKTEIVPKLTEHEFGDWTRVNDSLQRVCPCGETETIDIVNTTESIPETSDGIKVEISTDNAIPNGTVLITENLTEQMNDEDKQGITDAIGEMTEDGTDSEVVSMFEIHLELDGSKVQPDGTVTVTLPIPAEADAQFGNFMAVYVDDDGNVEEMPSETSDGTITFTTNHFSHYAIIGLSGSGESKYTVSGSFTSYGDETKETTVQLIPQGLAQATHEIKVTGNSGTYSIDDVAAGTYTVKVMKPNHVTREYEVIVGAEDVLQDVKICLIGDLTGDGIINSRDVDRLFAHVKKTSFLTDEYVIACADVVANGSLNSRDVDRLFAHVKKTALLW